MANIYDSEGKAVTEGLQGSDVCDEAIQAARELAADLGAEMYLEDDGLKTTVYPDGSTSEGWDWGDSDDDTPDAIDPPVPDECCKWVYTVVAGDRIGADLRDCYGFGNEFAACLLSPDERDTESDGCGVWDVDRDSVEWPDWEDAVATIVADRKAGPDAETLLTAAARRAGIDVDDYETEWRDDEWVLVSDGWIASYGDGAAEIVYPCAETPREAAQEYVESDDLVDRHETLYAEVRVWRAVFTAAGLRAEDETTVTLRIDPDEPDCADGHDHEWRSPYAVLGGLKENPGVWGRGSGVVVREVCRHCGTYRVTDTSGDHGETIGYEDADADSLAWVSSREEQP